VPWVAGGRGWAIAVPLALSLSACRSSLPDRLEDRSREASIATPPATDSVFAALVSDLSEPAGYFDTDNLISNEASYLHVFGPLGDLTHPGGAYIGVGPDQNFSYIAEVRPAVAFIIDIRRDNLLEHLMFKSIFEAAATRIEYLAILFGRPIPDNLRAWRARSIADLATYMDSASVSTRSMARARDAVRSGLHRQRVPLSDVDRATVARFHEAFIEAGLDLRFTSYNRGPQPYYPTYRQLMLERDLAGEYGHYLADSARFDAVKRLEDRNLVIPVIGDLAGPHAVRAIAAYLAAEGLVVSALYTSNVEFYLFGQGSFGVWADNLAALPYDESSVIIRSYFGGRFRGRHPLSVPGYYSTQLLQTMTSFVAEQEAGGYLSYYDLVTKHALPLR
jgi:hypothetical protein